MLFLISSSIGHSDALQIFVNNLCVISVAQGFLAQLYCSRSVALAGQEQREALTHLSFPTPLQLSWVSWSRALPVV